jgi:hypothetical protein
MERFFDPAEGVGNVPYENRYKNITKNKQKGHGNRAVNKNAGANGRFFGAADKFYIFILIYMCLFYLFYLKPYT